MHEDHAKEQYFFDHPTRARLARVASRFERPVLLCCPMVGQALHEQGKRVAVLDVDERFGHLPGFVRWDAYRPTPLPFEPDLVLVDPPFKKVRPDQLFAAVRTLSRGRTDVSLAVVMSEDREEALLGTFAAFGLRATDVRPGYVSVPATVPIRLYANFDVE